MYLSTILEPKVVIPVAAGVTGFAVGFTAGVIASRRKKGELTILTDIDGAPSASIEELHKAAVQAMDNYEAAVTVDRDIHRDSPDYDEETSLEEQVAEFVGQEKVSSETSIDQSQEVFERVFPAIDKTPINYGTIQEQVVTVDDTEKTLLMEEPEEVELVQTVNLFGTGDHDFWDEEKEAAKRVDGEPYVIPVAVFFENEYEWTQEVLTYYQGDDVVSDQADQVIESYHRVIGNLEFGHGSGDPNVVYVRNPSLKREWEVLLHTGKYEEEVLGLSVEKEYQSSDFKHSVDRKFRDD